MMSKAKCKLKPPDSDDDDIDYASFDIIPRSSIQPPTVVETITASTNQIISPNADATPKLIRIRIASKEYQDKQKALKELKDAQQLALDRELENAQQLDEVQKAQFDSDKNLYQVVKLPLDSILKNAEILKPIIDDAVLVIQMIVVLGWQFLKSYLIDKDVHALPFPTINEALFLNIMKTVAYPGRNVENMVTESVDTKDDLRNFYNSTFSELTSIHPSYYIKGYILSQHAAQMMTCLETNISTHFIDYLFKYVNCKWKKPQEAIIHKIKDKAERKKAYQLLNADIQHLKSDLIEDRIKNSDPRYHEWIRTEREFLFPKNIEISVAYDLKCRPIEYLKYAIYINQQIEKLGYRPYQVIPQRTSMVPRNIILDTCGMVQIIDKDVAPKLFGKRKTDLNKNSRTNHNLVWGNVLDIKLSNPTDPLTKENYDDYVFHNQIQTDGISCSLLYILKKHEDKTYGKHYDTKTEKKKKADKKKRSDALKKGIILEEEAEEREFQRLRDFNAEQCAKYTKENYKILVLDPGKIHPICMLDENDRRFQYSARQRRVETYTKRSKEILEREKKICGINEKEQILSYVSRRTLNPNGISAYIRVKNGVMMETKEFYEHPTLRKMAFRRYVWTKKSEHSLLKRIESRYLSPQEIRDGRKVVIFHGDYSRTSQMRGCIPTPNIGIKRLLKSKFEIVDVDEFRTSKLYCKTEGILKHHQIRRKHHLHSLHEVLTPKEETDCRIFVNRDINACMNMFKIVRQHFLNQTRPIRYVRGTKLEDSP